MSSLNPSFNLIEIIEQSAETDFSNTILNPSHPNFSFNPSNKHANNEHVEFLLHSNYRVNEQTTYGIIRPHLDLIESVKSCSEVDHAYSYIESFKSALISMSYRYIQSITASKDPNYNVFDQLRFQIGVISQNQPQNVITLLNVLQSYTRFLESFKESSLEETHFSMFWNKQKPNVEGAVLAIIKTRLENGDATPAQPVDSVGAIISSTQERSKSAGTIVVQPIAAPILETDKEPVAHDVDLIKVSEESSLDEYNKLRNTHRILPIIDELIKSTTAFSEIAKLQIEEFQTYFETYPDASQKIAIDLKARLTLLKHLDKFDHLRNGTLTPQDDFINVSLLQELNNILKSKNLPTILPKKFLELKSLIDVNGDQSLKNSLEDLFIQLSFNLAHYLFQHQVDFKSKYRNLDIEELIAFLNNFIQSNLETQKLCEKTRRFVEEDQSQRVLGYPLLPEKARIYTDEMIAGVLARAANADYQSDIAPSTPSPIQMVPLELPFKAEGVTEVNYTDFLSIIKDIQASFQEGQASVSQVDLNVVDLSKQGIEYLYEEKIGENINRMALVAGLAEHLFNREGATSDALAAVNNLESAKALHEKGQDDFLNAVAIEVLEKDVLRAKARKAGFKWVLTQLIKDYFKTDLIEKFARFLGKLTRK